MRRWRRLKLHELVVKIMENPLDHPQAALKTLQTG
jgi:hypothetical protein